MIGICILLLLIFWKLAIVEKEIIKNRNAINAVNHKKIRNLKL